MTTELNIDPEGINKIMLLHQNLSDTIYLKLESDKEYKYREIGIFNKLINTLQLKRPKAEHFHRAMNGFGLNHFILAEFIPKDAKIDLKTFKGRFIIPASKALELGSFLHFKQQGYEKQIFLSLADLAPFKTDAKT